jgi:hypothetical protein
MAERPAVRTRNLSRNKIAQITGNRPELIRAMEDLVEDVATTIPDAIGDQSRDVDTVMALAAFTRIPNTDAQQMTDTASNILASQIFGA